MNPAPPFALQTVTGPPKLGGPTTPALIESIEERVTNMTYGEILIDRRACYKKQGGGRANGGAG